jgi:hypothetical protein
LIWTESDNSGGRPTWKEAEDAKLVAAVKRIAEAAKRADALGTKEHA